MNIMKYKTLISRITFTINTNAQQIHTITYPVINATAFKNYAIIIVIFSSVL